MNTLHKTQILQSLCPLPLHLVWHENRRTYFSFRREKKQLSLRLHRLFLQAPTPVLEAVIQMALKKDPESTAIVKKMAHLYFSQNRGSGPALNSAGSVHHLQEIYERVKKAYFSADLEIEIGWSERSPASRYRSITFGTYNRFLNRIRIHPLLDDAEVPLYVVEFIVYHEMLHAVYLPRMDESGRCSIHTPEFKEKERQHPDYKRTKEWEKKSLQFFKMRKRHGRS